MPDQKKALLLINITYWMGIIADAVWTVGLLSPQIFAILTGRPDFNPDLPVRIIMGIGASLMAGWTVLLVWAVRKPVERRGVLLITAFPVVFGLFIVAVTSFRAGNTAYLWIVIKTVILFIVMIASYFLASKIAKGKE